MLRKIVAGTVFTGLAIGGFAVPAANAATAANGLLTINVPNVQVYKSAKCADYPFTVKVNVPEGEEWAVVGATQRVALDPNTKPAAWDVTVGTGPKPVRATMRLCPKQDGVGAFTYVAAAVRETAPKADPEFLTVKSTLKSPSAATAVVTPKHVKKGKTIKARGKVTYRTTSWAKRPIKKKAVTLQFQAVGTTTWTTVKTVKTTSNGGYSIKTKATTDGKYRVVYSGSSTIARGASAAKIIDVR